MRRLSPWRRTRPMRVVLTGLAVVAVLQIGFASFGSDRFSYGTQLSVRYADLWVTLFVVGLVCWFVQYHALLRAFRRWSDA